MVLVTEFSRTPRFNDNDGWDHHYGSFMCLLAGNGINGALVSAARVTDLHAKGLLGQTLVVLGTEFGRTPWINDNDGRDHDDETFTCLLASRTCGSTMSGDCTGHRDVPPWLSTPTWPDRSGVDRRWWDS